jgi:hypothetical protein
MTRLEPCSLADNVGESDYPETGRAGHTIRHIVQLRSEYMSLQPSRQLKSIYQKEEVQYPYLSAPYYWSPATMNFFNIPSQQLTQLIGPYELVFLRIFLYN